MSVITYGCILAGYLILLLVSQVNDYHYRFKLLLHHYSIANDIVFTPLFVLLGSKLIADNRQIIKIYIGNWIRPPCVQSLLLASMVCLASILLMPEPLMKAVYGFLISLRLDATAEHFALLIDQVNFPLPILACILLIIACCCIFKYRSINFALCTLSFSATYGILMVFQNIIWFNTTAGKAVSSQFVFEMEKLVVLPVTFSIGVYWFLGFYAIVAMLMEAFRQKRL